VRSYLSALQASVMLVTLTVLPSCSGSSEPVTVQPPDLKGSWVLNAAESEDPRAQMRARSRGGSRGGGRGGGSGGRGGGMGGTDQMLGGAMEAARVLKITQDDSTVTIVDADQNRRVLYPDGRTIEREVRGGRKIMIEYVLIPGVNNEPQHADELAAWMKPFLKDPTRKKAKGHGGLLNIIPYNPRRNSPWPAPTETQVDAFVDRLISHGVFVNRRRTKGRDTMAACGQLGTAEIRKRQFVPMTTNSKPNRDPDDQ